MQRMRSLTYISIIIFSYYIVYYFYIGVINPIPALGDSWDYHIPISKSILSGEFLYFNTVSTPQTYYPGSSEAINSLLMFLHIPLTVSNLLAVIVLFFVCFRLGRVFHLSYYTAIFFAATICTLNVFVRWYNAVSIDVWMAIFFLLAIILLERPQKSLRYFLQLGFFFGMIIGTKYTGWFFLILLSIVYGKTILKIVSFKRALFFFIPFSIFGLFWYIRNYLLMQNPFYPLPIFGFEGVHLFTSFVWRETLNYPWQMFNAVFGEYNVWFFLTFFVFGFYLYKKFSKQPISIPGIARLYSIGIVSFIFYFTFPTSYQPWIMVSSLRYSYPAFIPLILTVFLIAAFYKKIPILGLIAIGNMLMVLSTTFYPKLTLIYIPLAFGAIYFCNKYSKTHS